MKKKTTWERINKSENKKAAGIGSKIKQGSKALGRIWSNMTDNIFALPSMNEQYQYQRVVTVPVWKKK